MGGNAGINRPRVWILDKSPFSSVRKQEQCFYITTETFYSIQNVEHAVALPAPINGCRIEENKDAYDNYIVDSDVARTRLEEASFSTTYNTIPNPADPANPILAEQVGEFNASATAREQLRRLSGASETPAQKAQREFFTWQSQTSIFGDVPRSFSEAPKLDSAAEWTYISVPKPLSSSSKNSQNTNNQKADEKATGSSRILMPYQRKIPQNNASPVHWGLKMSDRPYNQPFELTYYVCYRDPSVAELAQDDRITPQNKFGFYYPDQNGKPDKEIDLKLNKGLYMAVELGEETVRHHYLLLFLYGHKPMMFWINHGETSSKSGSTDVKNDQTPCPLKPKSTSPTSSKETKKNSTLNGKFQAMLIAVYDNDSVVENMFNARQFTLSMESAGGIFYIRSSAFSTTPWLIHPNVINRTSGLFIGGTISVYGGNIQAGVAYAPIQYYSKGTVGMAGVTFDVTDSSIEPICSVGNLGPSQVLQDKTNSKDGKSNQRLMVDTEKLVVYNGVAGEPGQVAEYGYVNTLMGENFSKSLDRAIFIDMYINDPKADPEEGDALLGNSKTKDGCEELQKNVDISVFDAFGAPRGLLAFKTGTVTMQTYYPTIRLFTGDVKTTTGYVIKNGRSSYIWMLRLYIEPEPVTQKPGRMYDLSCDVMSVDLSWNSTGPGEITCSGSIKVLASPRSLGSTEGKKVPNLMDLTKRISYIEIDVERSNSVIRDSVAYDDDGNADARIFTGCIVGAEVQEEPGKTVINFKVEDYMWVLQACKFNLSPYYDGMFYNYAIADMVAQTGFPYDRMWMDDVHLTPVAGGDAPNTDNIPSLPCTNMFEQPQFRFKDGDALKDGIARIAKMDWKMFYFDSWGDFRYDEIPWGMHGNKEGTALFKFFTGDSLNWTPENLVWNSVSRSYAMKDMYNSLQVITVSKAIPSLYLMYQDTNRSSIDDPKSIGYIGFPKVMRQKEALFERADAAFGYFNDLKDVLYLPPKTIRFETYGRVGMRPASVVYVDGEPWRMMNITLKMDASKNEFWASVEGEWFDSVSKSATGNSEQPTT